MMLCFSEVIASYKCVELKEQKTKSDVIQGLMQEPANILKYGDKGEPLTL